jgi:hypothetical protein
VTERQKVEFRAEFYNALNHPNFGLPNSDIDAGPGAAGAITALNTPMRTVICPEVPVLTAGRILSYSLAF